MYSLKQIIPYLQGDFTQGIRRVGSHIYIDPKQKHEYTFIWMHGLEDVPDSFLAGFNNPELCPFNQNTKIILLCAPTRPLTKNGGEEMTSWYDIMRSDWKQHIGQLKYNEIWGVAQALESRDFILDLITEEPIPLKNIYLGGFSQGCCMALLAGLHLPEPIGGIIGHSGYLFPFAEINNNSRILICHGDEDQVTPVNFALETYKPIKHLMQFEILKGVEHAMMMQNFDLMKQFVKLN